MSIWIENQLSEPCTLLVYLLNVFFFCSPFGSSVDFVNPLHLLHSPLFYFCKTETLCSVFFGVFSFSERCFVMCDIVLGFDFVKFCPIESLLFVLMNKCNSDFSYSLYFVAIFQFLLFCLNQLVLPLWTLKKT